MLNKLLLADPILSNNILLVELNDI